MEFIFCCGEGMIQCQGIVSSEKKAAQERKEVNGELGRTIWSSNLKCLGKSAKKKKGNIKIEIGKKSANSYVNSWEE